MTGAELGRRRRELDRTLAALGITIPAAAGPRVRSAVEPLDDARLRAQVEEAHRRGCLVRFYAPQLEVDS